MFSSVKLSLWRSNEQMMLVIITLLTLSAHCARNHQRAFVKTFTSTDNILFFSGFPSNISYIHMRNVTLDVFNVSEIRWRRLKSLSITDGKINRVKGQFRMMTPTTCLNLSNNALIEVENNSLTRLAQLTTLDLSYNNLTHLPALNTMNGREFWLDISGKLNRINSFSTNISQDYARK